MIVRIIILSLIGSFCLAVGIVSMQMRKSNNYGDSMGSVNEFAQGTWNLMDRTDYKTKKRKWQEDWEYLEEQTKGDFIVRK